MRRLPIPLLSSVLEDPNLQSVLRCSDRQVQALETGGDFQRRAMLFRLRAQNGISFTMNRLQQAWQGIVQQHPQLRTSYAIGAGAADMFQVVMKDHTPAFSHVHLGHSDNVEVTARQAELPKLTPEVPMHLVHIFTSDDNSTLFFRLCYSGIDLEDNDVVDILTSLAQNPHSWIVETHTMHTLKERSNLPMTIADRIKFADPTVVGAGLNKPAGPQPATNEYTNVTLSRTLGKDLIRSSSEQGVSPLNLVQSLSLIVLSKFLNIEQPCCFYALPANRTRHDSHKDRWTRQRVSICTTQVVDDDPVANVTTRLYEQTKDDAENVRHQSIPTTYNGKRLCNAYVRWSDQSTVWSTPGEGLSVEPVMASGIVEYDIELGLIYTGESLVLQVIAVSSIEGWQARSIAAIFIQGLEFILQHPYCLVRDIPTCTPSDIDMLQTWNHGVLVQHRSCIHDLVQKRAHLHPDSPAVDGHDGFLTYRDLDTLTSRVAHIFFTRLRFQPGEKVILMLPHSIWTIVAMLSVMKAGSAFIPLDGNSPFQRLKSIATRAKTRYIITADEWTETTKDLGVQVITLNQSFVDKNAPCGRERFTVADLNPKSLAYVIFTSGSTGEPKGCAIEHQAYCSSALAYGPRFGMGANTRVLQFSSYSFDASLIEILTGLLCGSCICVPSDHDRMNDLGQAASRLGATWAMLTPSLVSKLNLEAATCLKTLVLVGEPMTTEVKEAWVRRLDLIGGYGPSETGPISAVVGPLTSESSPTNIGLPVANKSWVVDKSDHDKLVPVGAVGELVIEGPSLGRGYIGDEEKTRQVFIESPAWTYWPQFHDSRAESRRMYKTGDLVIRCGDGTLEYIGRKDMQVKIRGQRVELGDIEAHLKRIVGVELAVEVGVPQGCDDTEKMLVAFLCLGDEGTVVNDLSSVDVATQARLVSLLRDVDAKLSSKIASYMLPMAYLTLQALPVSVSGKRDRRKLRQIIASLSKQDLLQWAAPTSTGGRPLMSDMDHRIASLWGVVLGINPDGLALEDDFVKQGGDSLAAMRLANMCKGEGVKLSFRDIYLKSRLLGDQAELASKRSIL